VILERDPAYAVIGKEGRTSFVGPKRRATVLLDPL